MRLTKPSSINEPRMRSVVALFSEVASAISVKLFIADTDEEARELGRRYYPPYFALQADHYEADADPWVGIPEYTDFSRMFANSR